MNVNYNGNPIKQVLRSGRISSVYIVSKWVVGCGLLVTLFLNLWILSVFECLEYVGMCWNVLECVRMCWNVLEYFGMFGKCCNMLEWVRMCWNAGVCWNMLECVGVFVPWRPGKPC